MIDFGLAPEAFDEGYLEKNVHLHRGAVRADLFDWSELDAVLHRIEPRAPALQLFRHGIVAEEDYTDEAIEFGQPRRRLDRARFHALLSDGATLVINRVENQSLIAKRLCAKVARFSGQATVSNGYLSRGGDGTFGKHWDTHDVFALQLIGRKRWHVFPPTFPLPLAMHASAGSGHRCPERPVLDCVLSAGDLLYVPRGWWHQAIPFDEPSFHLSVGTYGATVHDYLMWACARHLPGLEGARRSLRGAPDGAELAGVIDRLRDVVLDPAAIAAFRRELSARERVVSEPDTALFLGAGVEGLGPGATVVLNVPAATLDGDDVAVSGGRLRLSPVSRAVVALLCDAGSLPVGTLCARLPRVAAHAVRAAVLDLARYDIVTVEPEAS